MANVTRDIVPAHSFFQISFALHYHWDKDEVSHTYLLTQVETKSNAPPPTTNDLRLQSSESLPQQTTNGNNDNQ